MDGHPPFQHTSLLYPPTILLTRMVTISLTSLVTAIWGGWMSPLGAGREWTVGRGQKASSLFVPAVLGTYFCGFSIATKWYRSNTGALHWGITVYFTVTGGEMCRLLLITAHTYWITLFCSMNWSLFSFADSVTVFLQLLLEVAPTQSMFD